LKKLNSNNVIQDKSKKTHSQSDDNQTVKVEGKEKIFDWKRKTTHYIQGSLYKVMSGFLCKNIVDYNK